MSAGLPTTTQASDTTGSTPGSSSSPDTESSTDGGDTTTGAPMCEPPDRHTVEAYWALVPIDTNEPQPYSISAPCVVIDVVDYVENQRRFELDCEIDGQSKLYAIGINREPTAGSTRIMVGDKIVLEYRRVNLDSGSEQWFTFHSAGDPTVVGRAVLQLTASRSTCIGGRSSPGYSMDSAK